MLRKYLLVQAALVSVVFACTSLAQEDSEGESRSIIEEVVVTAEKRSESEMTVPMAITAFDSFKIEKLKIENVNDLALMTPGLEATTHAHNNLFTMRGVGTTFSSAHLSESAVAVYQSGLATLAGRTAGIDTDGFDIDRIEVLRGPQNTIYGRNGVGGTINFVRKRPQFDTSGEFLAEFGTSENRRVGFAYTGPVALAGLGDQLAYRLTAHVNQRAGQQRNLGRTDLSDHCDVGGCSGDDIDSVDNWTISPQLEWRGENWNLNLLANWYESNRLMGRNLLGEFPAGSLPDGLSFPTHVNDGVSFGGVRRLASVYGWDAKIPTEDGAVQFNRDTTHWIDSSNAVATFDWQISDTLALRYQTGVSEFSDLRHRDVDLTDRTGTPGEMNPSDPSVWPKADDNGGPYRDRLSIEGNDYDVDQHELQLTSMIGENVEARVGVFTLNAESLARFDQKHYENAAFYRSTLDDLRALHAVGGAPDLGATFPSGTCEEILTAQFGQTFLDEAQGAPVAPFSSAVPGSDQNLTGWIPGYLTCYDEDGVGDGVGGLNSPSWAGLQYLAQEQFSVFGEINWQLNPQWNVSLGVRSIDDEKPVYEFRKLSNAQALGTRFNPFAQSMDITSVITGDDRGACNDSAFLDDEEISLEECLWDQFYEMNDVAAPRWLDVRRNQATILEYGSTVFNLDLEYSPTEDVFLFGRVATGYRSGGTNAIPTVADDYAPFLFFDPEELLTWEAGVKARFPDIGMRVMTSAYLYTYENYIANVAVTLCPDEPWECAAEPNVNYGDVRISGVDFEFAWDVPGIEGLSIFGFYALNNGEVREPYVLPEYVWTGNEDIPQDAQFQYFQGSLTGNNLPNNPKNKFNLSSEYAMPLNNGSSLSLLGVYSRRGGFDAYVSNNENEKSEAYDRVDLNVTWTAPSQTWSVSVFGHNIFDEQEVELFEFDVYEYEDPSTGEEVFLPVPDPFVSGWRYWGSEIRYRF